MGNNLSGCDDRGAVLQQLVVVMSFRGEDSGAPFRIVREEVTRNLTKLGADALKKVVQALLALTLLRDGRRVNQKCFQYPWKGMRIERFQFELADPFDRAAAMAVCALDARITQMRPSLVPSEMTESTYFCNYFTHVAALRAWALRGDAAVLDTAPPVITFGRARGRLDFSVGDKTFSTLSSELVKQGFTSKEGLVAFIAHSSRGVVSSIPTTNDSSITASFLRNRNGKASSNDNIMVAKRKGLVMALMRVSEPNTVLGALLELSMMDERMLNSAFWQRAEGRVLALSATTEAFTDVDLFVAPEPKFQALFDSINQLLFDAKRDYKVVQAAWELDPNLSVAFQGFVPRLLSKDEFWTNYLKHAMHCIVMERIFGCGTNKRKNH